MCPFRVGPQKRKARHSHVHSFIANSFATLSAVLYISPFKSVSTHPVSGRPGGLELSPRFDGYDMGLPGNQALQWIVEADMQDGERPLSRGLFGYSKIRIRPGDDGLASHPATDSPTPTARNIVTTRRAAICGTASRLTAQISKLTEASQRLTAQLPN